MNTEKQTKTAAQAYNEKVEQIESMLLELQEKLEAHKKSQSKNEKHWGYVGDLATVADYLGDAINKI